MNSTARVIRYNRVAIVLHWTIAILVLGLIPVGLIMEDAPKAIQGTVYQMHKSFGLMVLFLSLARLGWRLANPPPPLPDSMKAWEKQVASITHWAFYFLIIAIPLSGWMLVSASPKNIPTMFLTLFHWPHIWFLANMDVAQKKEIAGIFDQTHVILAYGAIALIVLHVGAALRHQYWIKDNEMARMIPRLGHTVPPQRQPRGALLILGVPAVLFVAIALLGNLPGKAAPAAELQNGASGNWLVDPQASTLTFTFHHAGRTITGRFDRWQANINFDPQDLEQAAVTVKVDLGSAHTGEQTYDEAMPQADWFDIAAHPVAVFTSTGVSARGDGHYVMKGLLRLRGASLPLRIPFTLAIDGNQARAAGKVQVDRLAYGIGANADATAQYVSRMVEVHFSLAARRRPPG